jgi:RNA polymerase sigma-70 factor (ECF subfamily)
MAETVVAHELPAVSEESDETLALRAAHGCRTSFAILLERHYDRIYRLAWRWTRNPAAAEDVAQEVALKLAKAIGGYRADAAFPTWLHRITYTTAVDFLRASQRTVATDPSEIVRLVDVSEAGGAPPDGSVGELWDAVLKLSDQQRDAVLLVYCEDMSHAEAAAVMGCSEKTVSWHIHEAKRRLRLMIEAVG